MRRNLLAALSLLILSLGAAQAQNWIGFRTGYPLGLTVHYGIADALTNGFDLRISGKVVARGSIVSVGLGLDAMREVVSEAPFSVYVGGGPSVEVGGNVVLDVHALVGGEFRFVDLGLPQLGLFVEGTLGAEFDLSTGGANIPSFGAALGVNWELR